MSSEARRKAMIGIGVAVLVWPLVHLRLVEQVRIDPWELFGWAMYSKPAARVQVAVDVEREGRLVPLRARAEDGFHLPPIC